MKSMLLCAAAALASLIPTTVMAQQTHDLTVLGRLAESAGADLSAFEGLGGGTAAGGLRAAAAPPAGDLDAGTAARLAGAGILGGAIGFFGGAYLGAWIADRRDSGLDDLNVVRGMLVGATMGESLLLPAGVHLANDRRGSYWISALVSLGIGAGGVGLMEASHWDPPATPIIAVAVPVAQLATSIAIERSGN